MRERERARESPVSAEREREMGSQIGSEGASALRVKGELRLERGLKE